MKMFSVLSLLMVSTCMALPQRRPPEPQEYPQQTILEQQQQRHSQEQYQRQSFQAAQPQQYDSKEPRNRETTTYIPIIRFDKEQGQDGSYKASYETGNNIIAEEEGYIKDLGPDPEQAGENLHAQVQQGSYSYTAPDGVLITVNYVADETGFHATGDHLPTPPPVSPEVQKGLDIIFAGIKAQREAEEKEPKEHLQGRKEIPQDHNGQYRQQ